MDYRNQKYEDKHSNGMATASFVLGIIGAATFCCVYPPIICGALAIILALLSRAGETTLSVKAKIGMILGIVSAVMGVVMIIYSLTFIFIGYGSYENYWNSLYELYDFSNLDFYSNEPYSL